jgi:hypothetical protein
MLRSNKCSIFKLLYLMKKIYIIVATMLMFSLTGCTNWLDQEPLSNVTTSAYFKNASDFKAGATYFNTQAYGWAEPNGADEGSDLNYIMSTELSGSDGAPASDTYYSNPYKYLRHINNLITQAAAYKGTDNISVPKGQAYFYRAWWHFELLKRYGGITLALEAPSTTSETVWGPRNSRYEVVNQILADLEQAKTLLASTTKVSSSNDGSVNVETACALKARVCLFEGTWEKYNGRGSTDATNGDGTITGGGIKMPSTYPSVTDLLTMAKVEAAKFVSGGIYASEYSVWMQAENSSIAAYKQQSTFYLFALEGADSNPYGVTKVTNNEAVFRRVYDYATQFYGNANMTHSMPVGGSRKLIDMYLCTDGLPVHKSPLFQGYSGLNTEFVNRDARMVSLFKQIGSYYWSANGEYGNVAKYTIAPSDDATNKGGCYYPWLTTYSATTYNGFVGYAGRKFMQERSRSTTQESADYMYIRLPEMLLAYAEATYELDGSISDADLMNTVNVIRNRAHIANLTNSLVSTNGLDMLQEIRRERTLEFVGEHFRKYDLCRWGIAELELARPTCTYYVSYSGTPTALATANNPVDATKKIYDATVWAAKGYVTTAEEAQSTYTAGMPTVKAGALITETKSNRKFTKKNYLLPIPSNDIKLNSELKQNPSW